MTRRIRYFAKALLVGCAAWAAGVGSAGSVARADIITLDPDGPAAGNSAMQISGFDFAPGNFLGQGLVTAINAFTTTQTPQTFQAFYQANLLGFSVPGQSGTVAPAGLNTAFEITAVASFTAQLFNFNAATSRAEFRVAPTQVNNFLRFFYDTAVNSSNLAGTGFNDGTLILSALPTFAANIPTSFTQTSSMPVNPPFDSFGTNNYMGKQTVSGNGVVDFESGTVSTPAPGFFVPGQVLSIELDNGSLFLPFNLANPSGLFTSTGPNTPPTVTPNPGMPTVTNGQLPGPDFQFQIDGNFTPTAIPEPGSMTLLGMGLAGAFGYGWRKRKQSA